MSSTPSLVTRPTHEAPLPDSHGSDAGLADAARHPSDSYAVYGLPPKRTGNLAVPCMKTFGLKKSSTTQPVFDPGAANYDYTQKYAEDPLFYELEENARVWHVYNDEARDFDVYMIEEIADSLDILLVFAGLFSAVLTTFVVQTFQSLSPDSSMIVIGLLEELIALQRADGIGASLDSVEPISVTTSPSVTDQWVNGLWFTSLTLSLSTALVAVLAKQWLHQYHSRLSGSPRDRAILRQFRFDGLERWHVRSIIGFLPLLLHTSLALFLIGLVLLLAPLNIIIAAIMGSATFILLSAYLLMNILPIALINCPYRTPLTHLLYALFQRIRDSVQRLSRLFLKGQTKLPRSSGSYRDLNSREAEAAAYWTKHSSGVPETLLSLWNTTTNSTAKKVVRDSVVALGDIESMHLTGTLDMGGKQACKSAYHSLEGVVKSCFLDNWAGFTCSNGNLSDLPREEKLRIERTLLASIALSETSQTAPGVNRPYRDISWPWSYGCQVRASDLALALIAMADDDRLTVSITGDETFCIPTTTLQCKAALPWLVRHHNILDIPVFPTTVWRRLWAGAEWTAEDMSGIRQLFAQAGRGPYNVSHGPVDLTSFLVGLDKAGILTPRLRI